MAQLGWLIDLDKCTGCDSCTVACKAENNTRPLGSPMPFKSGGVLPDHVSYRWVVKKETGVYPNPALTFVTMSCNHCEHPACLAACPVSNVNEPSNETNAIFKREADGIVLINQEFCIGCKNCIQACPYGAPQFNSITEKVEKCTFCIHRLDAGLQPACVTTCVGNALHVVDNFNFAESGQNAPQDFADPALTVPAVKFATS
jgi:Fe-S-cluster-containing dehydrogenase component